MSLASAFLLTALAITPAATPAHDFRPDPASVRRYGPAYRYPQAGWIVLHVEGKPYERGYQHGRLMADEIAAYVRCFAAVQSSRAPADAWKLTRTLTSALFVRRYHKEFLEEMKGIADGAAAAGAKFDNRKIDLVDIVALNSLPEIETLHWALEATPTGLEGLRFPKQPAKRKLPAKPEHCSAFVATGPATADGKVVFGHITMFGLYPSNFYNVWLDVKPEKGYRVLMQSYPGGIQSGMDYYLNSAGILVAETTISQTRFDVKGYALGSRIRQALQYSDSIDKVVAILKDGNNGLYTNEWLLADTRTNEIAMFELGTHKSKLYRSSKKEWFGNTPGFYWGCNNTKDVEVRLEVIASVEGRAVNMVFHPSDRDKVWQRLYRKHRGKIDEAFAREAFTTPPLAAASSLDAKFTTTALARDLKTWALFGPPLGRTWQPTPEQRRAFPEVKPLVSNPWTVLHAAPPPRAEKGAPVAVDLEGKAKESPAHPDTKAAWHGTLLPRTDADTWLVTAFANYERIVALEKALKERADKHQLTAGDRELLAVALAAYRSQYAAGVLASADVPLEQTRAAVDDDGWYRVAVGKGVGLLHELRRLVDADQGEGTFVKLMEEFGKQYAGKKVSTEAFRAHVSKRVKRDLAPFFKTWLSRPGLQRLRLDDVKVVKRGKQYAVTGTLHCSGTALPVTVDVLVQTSAGDQTLTVKLDTEAKQFHCTTGQPPRRVVVDPHGQVFRANGGAYGVSSFHADLEDTLIVYGTKNEAEANREAAEALQGVIRGGPNVTLPVRKDSEVKPEELRNHHVILIGRPDSNALVARFADALPVRFGRRSFVVGEDVYAHAGSAVVTAAENPLNRRYSLVVVAGLGAASTYDAASSLHRAEWGAEVLVLPHGKQPRSLVLPPCDLVWVNGNGEKAVKAGNRR